MKLYSAYLVKLPLALFYQIMLHLVALKTVLGVLVGAAGVIITAMCLSWSSVSWAQDSAYSDSQSDYPYVYYYLMVTGADDKFIISSAAQNDKVIGHIELTSDELGKIYDSLDEHGKVRAVIDCKDRDVTRAYGFLSESEDALSSGHMFDFEILWVKHIDHHAGHAHKFDFETEETTESFSSHYDGSALYFAFWGEYGCFSY